MQTSANLLARSLQPVTLPENGQILTPSFLFFSHPKNPRIHLPSDPSKEGCRQQTAAPIVAYFVALVCACSMPFVFVHLRQHTWEAALAHSGNSCNKLALGLQRIVAPRCHLAAIAGRDVRHVTRLSVIWLWNLHSICTVLMVVTSGGREWVGPWAKSGFDQRAAMTTGKSRNGNRVHALVLLEYQKWCHRACLCPAALFEACVSALLTPHTQHAIQFCLPAM